MYQISVACGCDIGRVRARNEDNIYLNGRTLEQNNRGLKGILTAKYLLDTEKCFAVFDGMGGEQAGDAAAFTAARALRAGQERLPVSESAGQYAAAVAAPILCGGDVLGLVLFVSAEDRLPGEGEYKLAQAVAGFLGKHMET